MRGIQILCLLLISLSVCPLIIAQTCDTCLAYPGKVTIDCSSPTASVAVQKAIGDIERFCKYASSPSSYPQCIANTVSYAVDVFTDRASEYDLSSEVLEPSRLCSVITLCTVACCETDFRPEQVHLSQGLNYDTMVVSWVTLKPLSNPVVYYWKASEPTEVFKQVATNSTYFAGGWEGTIYNASLSNLLPSTVYYYRIGSNTNDPNERLDHRFITSVAPSAAPLAPRNLTTTQANLFVPGVTASVVAFYGDMSITENSQEEATSLLRLAVNQTIQLVIQGGDLSYANGDQSKWDVYGRMVAPFSSSLPVMTAPGNHEVYYHFDAYRHRFFMPWQESGSHSKQYYSFNYEKIHFVSWSFEAWNGLDLLPGEPQREWLEADLAQANKERDVRPWVVLFGHRPFYCSAVSEDCGDVAAQLRELMEDLINKYHVDVVLQAHKHYYERTYPVYQEIPDTDYVDPTAPMYYVVGVGGKEKNDNWAEEPDWSVYRDDTYGYLLMSAPSEDVLEMAYMSKSYNIHDSATISRTQPITEWTFAH